VVVNTTAIDRMIFFMVSNHLNQTG